jgi:hypothetical protein
MANLDKIVNLIKKTGDKAIILDHNGDPSYVVMTLGSYEQLILGRSGVQGLTEDELLDKINREIAIWKDEQRDQNLPLDQYDFARDLGLEGKQSVWNSDYFNEDEETFEFYDEKNVANFSKNYGNNSNSFYEIPGPSPIADILANKLEFKPKSEPENEDRYYFEPVE